MSDQLPLRLEPGGPALPRLPELRPMLPRPVGEPFDSVDHLFEPWWGGVRALVYVGPAERPGGGAVRVVDADGRDVTDRLPELDGLAVRVDARSAILDGELVVADAAGRADPAALDARLAGRTGSRVAFLAFDLLHVDGRSLLGRPLARRRDALRRILRPGDEVVAVPAIATEGRALWAAVTAQGVAGVLARHRGGPYLPGVRSRLWGFVAAGRPGDASADDALGDRGEPLPPPAGSTGPVLALFERLPLEDVE